MDSLVAKLIVIVQRPGTDMQRIIEQLNSELLSPVVF